MYGLTRFVALLTVGALSSASSVGAQQKGHEPRPLAGSPTHTLPTYPSVQAYLAAHSASGSLWSRMTRSNPVQPVALPRSAMPANLTRLDGRPAGLAPLPADGSLRIERAPNGSVRWLRLQPGSLNIGKGASLEQTALGVLQSERAEMRLSDPTSELELISSETDALGASHLRFAQRYAGVPVWNRDLYVHLNAQGQPYLINGSYEPTPTGDVQLTAALSDADALTRVESAMRTAGRWNPVPAQVADRLGLGEPTTELVLYPTAGRGLRLAYEVTLHPNLIEWVTTVVDAATGETLTQIDRHCSLNPAAATVSAPTVDARSLQSAPAGVLAGAFGNGSGTDLNGKTQQFRVWNNGSGTAYSLWDFANFNAAKAQLPDQMAGGAMVLTVNNKDLGENVQIFHVTSTNGAWSDRSAVSASVNGKLAYDYYKNTFGRNAIDDKDEFLISIVHVTQSNQPMDNAYWNGRLMAYGDGATAFKPLAGGIDVAGHEMTHGIVQHTANLVYQDQSGALNESMADVFGIMIDRANFLMGEDIMRPGQGIALRDLENPSNPSVLADQPSTMATYNHTTQDNGGVHINSGIPNNAAVRIIKALGREKTEQIYYRALSKYLTRNSQFIDCRNAVEQAATDLYGGSGAEVAAVRTAFDAVGITGSTPPPPGNDVPPVTGGVSSVAFRTATGAIGVLNLTTNSANLLGANARVSQGGAEGSQLTAPADGSRIWFIDQTRHLSAVDTRTGQVGTFGSTSISQDGDLWSVAISPDENYAAIVSAYDNDPTLYIFDGQSLSQIELLPETSQQGILDHSIQYPDAVSWSPNNSQPKIAFDAYSEVQVGNIKASYWSMYEIDFARSKIYGLVSSQPANVNIGNIVYSHTNPDLIAFNVFENGDADVYLSNFDSGEQGKLDLPTYKLNSVALTDVERPSFSPDDRKLVMTSPANQALLIYDLTASSNPLSAVTFGQPLYGPQWFVLGGTVAVEDRSGAKPTDFRLEPAAPNPFNPSTTIRYQLSTVSPVRLEIFDALGRRVRTLVDEQKSAGSHAATFDAAGLPSGLYLARLTAGGRSLTQRLTLLR